MRKRKILICIISIIVLLICTVYFIKESVRNRINRSIEISEWYSYGYSDGQTDASDNAFYGTTKSNDYENLKLEYKLAYDAGYGYGYNDLLEGITQHEGYGDKYVPWDFSELEYRIYCLFTR